MWSIYSRDEENMTAGESAKRVAVIDTGTNSTRLLVADIIEGRVDEVARRTNITRLGEGVDQTGKISEAARDRVRARVSEYAEIIGNLGASEAIIIATSSVRDARDGEEFISSMASDYSYSYIVLSGQQEASLGFRGATLGSGGEMSVLLFDVGGGSTEVVKGKRGKAEYSVSMDIGCVRVTERFLGTGRASGHELDKAAGEIDLQIEKKVQRDQLYGFDEAIAVAGTVTSLAAIDQGLRIYDRELVHGHTLSRRKVEELLSRLAGMTLEERIEKSILGAGRADVIVAGTLIVLRLMDYSEVEELRVSERDILDGAAVSFAAAEL